MPNLLFDYPHTKDSEDEREISASRQVTPPTLSVLTSPVQRSWWSTTSVPCVVTRWGALATSISVLRATSSARTAIYTPRYHHSSALNTLSQTFQTCGEKDCFKEKGGRNFTMERISRLLFTGVGQDPTAPALEENVQLEACISDSSA